HLIIGDASSLSVFFRDLFRAYDALLEGKEPYGGEELPVQYADVAVRRQEQVESKALDSHFEYWKQHLSGVALTLNLPTDRPRPRIVSSKGSSYRYTMAAALTRALREACRREQTTMAMVVQIAFCVVLAEVSGQKDFVLGMPFANRPRTELQQMVGFLVALLPL